jgi:hypothetical protein
LTLNVSDGTVVEVLVLATQSEDQSPLSVATMIHPDIQLNLNDFVAVFADPMGLPPSRHCDHTIPLIQGAQSFNIRSYRYPPVLKDEIEKQVSDMLAQGVIQKK